MSMKTIEAANENCWLPHEFIYMGLWPRGKNKNVYIKQVTCI